MPSQLPPDRPLSRLLTEREREHRSRRRPTDTGQRGHAVEIARQLAGVPISVGFQSGSHYASIQALESYMPRDQINLSFNDGMLFKRMELLLDGKIPAATLFSGPYYLAEQLGFLDELLEAAGRDRARDAQTTGRTPTGTHARQLPRDLR